MPKTEKWHDLLLDVNSAIRWEWYHGAPVKPLKSNGWNQKIQKIGGLGGGFKYFFFSPLLGEMIQFDYIFFSDGLKPPPS